MSKTRRPKELITEPSVNEIWSSGRTSPNYQQQLAAPVPVRSLSNPVPPSPPLIIQDRKTSLASSISSTTSSGWGHSPERIEIPSSNQLPINPRKESASSISNSQRSAVYLEPENLQSLSLFASSTKTKVNKLTLAGPPRRSSDLEPPQRSPSPLHTPGPSPTFGHNRRKKSREEKEPSFLASLFGSRPASPSFDISAQSTSNNHHNSSKTAKSSGFNANSNCTSEAHSHSHARKMSAGNAIVALGLPEDDGPRRKSFDSYQPNDIANYGYFSSSDIAPFVHQQTSDGLGDLRKTTMATISSSVESQPPSHRRHGFHKRTNSSDSEQIQMGLENGSSVNLVSHSSNNSATHPVKEKKAGFLYRLKNGKKKKTDSERTPEESIRHGTSALNTPVNEKDDYFSPHNLPMDLNLTDMEGILNYNNIDATSNFHGSFEDYHHKDFQSYVTDFREFPPGGKNEIWLPPDSWAVLKPSPFGMRFDERDNFDISSNERLYCIRIFRPDATFGTVNCSLNTTTAELCQILGKKFFIQDISKYNLYVKRNNMERVLAPQERPLQLQKKWLEQVGYSESDKLEDLGREDNSYLVRFTYRQATMPTRIEGEENRTSYKHVDLQARNLQTIPIFLHQHAYTIRSLDVSQNLLIDLPTDFIQSCIQLRELNLAQNDFERIPQSVLNTEMLSKLTLSSNHLQDLDHIRLDSLRSLNNLQLDNNLLKTLPEHFARMSSLSTLNLSNNYFKTFPEVLCKISTLQELDMSFNQISSIPEEIGDLSSLERLIMIGNRIAGSLPASFAKLVKLRYLNLCHNMIHSIEVLSNCPRLQQLYVESNSVSIVDISASSLKELYFSQNHLTQFSLMGTSLTLTTLCLTRSKLTTLPDTLFEHLLAVERLELCYNQLVSLPSTISALQKLIHFNCTNNLLTELPPEIGRLRSLHSLDVHINNISKLPREIWLCQRLESFNASSNLLKYFPAPYKETAPSLSPIPSSPSTVPLVAPTFERMNSSTPTLGSFVSSSNGDSSVKSGPPLASSLRALFLGDNQLRNDIFAVISVFTELRVLNLAFNYLDEFPKCSLMSSHLTELYLSGNEFGALPDEIDQLTSLRVLHVNGNKLQTLPAELSKIRKLLVLDVGSNALKYNIANWQFDWNWNWNIELKYLNLSGNKRFEIKPNHLHEVKKLQDRNLAAFDSLSRLRVLGLMDVTLLNLSVPDDSDDRRVRTSGSEVNSMAYGMADTLGQLEHLTTWEAVIPKFNNRENECLFGLFDSRASSNQGGRVTKYLHDWFPFHFSSELKKIRDTNETIESALRRSFLSLNKELGAKVFNSNLEMNLDFQREKNATSNLGIDDNKSGASGLIAYIKDTTLYVANVGDIVAVISRNRGNADPIAQKHSPMTPSEIARIRNAGGFFSHKRLVNGELEVSRSFGHFHLIPAVNANPTVKVVQLEEQDEFVIIATRGLWDRISYQTAVDIAYNEYTERGDLMRAAQKLRDFAIAYGAKDSIMVMIIGVEDIFGGTRKWEASGAENQNNAVGNTYYIRGRRRDEDKPSDSTIARLQKEIEPPTGKIALVFTDIKNSTFLWETIPIAMRHAIKQHNTIMRRLLRNIGGYEVKTEGDAFMVSFPTVSSALLWCFTVQMQLLQADWPTELLELEDGKEVYGGHDSELIYRGLSVRMGIHWGSPVCETDPITKRMDYFGPMVNRAARICNAADGGQICVSADVESEIRLLQTMMENDPMGTSRKNSQDAEGEYEVAAAAAAALESSGRIEGSPNINSNIVIDKTILSLTNLNSGNLNSGSGMDKTILSLRKMGFVVRKIGETKLKGLENPEELSLIYPEPLKGRLEEDQAKANQRSSVIASEKIYEPSTQILDPASVRSLGYLCLRLERVASGYVNTRRTRNSRTDYLTGLLTFHVKDNADDEELLRITESLITRIENAISTLALKKVGPYSKVLDAIIIDPELVSKALQMYAQIMGASK
ncbi:14591_t:CDS:10 [Ambispora leptoticha]|uniref:Adenylate cyclase n=1 Tax=Ambispora leptoticha TaxID=144679 RepID=A0A9N8V6R3_9GLOM|nr:14591_t:CDS:10 [Ambispora leptoticha]